MTKKEKMKVVYLLDLITVAFAAHNENYLSEPSPDSPLVPVSEGVPISEQAPAPPLPVDETISMPEPVQPSSNVMRRNNRRAQD